MERECVVFQTYKGENLAYPGFLQPLPLPEKAWYDISMDFVEGLPLFKGNSTILVVVDRLTKYGHFIALSHLVTTTLVSLEYLQQTYKLHGRYELIVSDRDKVLFSHFWQELFKHLGI